MKGAVFAESRRWGKTDLEAFTELENDSRAKSKIVFDAFKVLNGRPKGRCAQRTHDV